MLCVPFAGISVLDCEINTTTIYRQLTSMWFFSHLVGWCFAQLCFRSFWLTLFLSWMFEFMEMSLQFLIPEFKECWWDAIFLDCFVANLIGCAIGWKIVCYLNAKEYNWTDDKWGGKVTYFFDVDK